MGEWCCELRLGGPSWVYPEDVLPNVRRLAGWVQDVEWLVLEVTHGLPGPEVAEGLAALGKAYGHSYTVHLPLDLPLGARDEHARHKAVETAREVIEATQRVQPWAYVLHLEPAPEAPDNAPAAGSEAGTDWSPWHERVAESLHALGAGAGGEPIIAVENVPEYPPEALWPLLDRLDVSLCLDVGHLLRQGRDPRPLLERHLARTRVIHLHGVEDGHDHRSLAAMDQGVLAGLLRTIRRRSFHGVVTIECFAAEPFFESWELVEGIWRRLLQSEAEV